MGYDPNTGRWLQRDPIESGNNLYQYVEGDPIDNTDPSGLQASRPASTPTTTPASGPSEDLPFPDAGSTLLHGKELTTVGRQQGTHADFKWLLLIQGVSQRLSRMGYSFHAMWQFFIHDIDYKKIGLGTGATIDVKQWVKRREYQNSAWGTWPDWRTDMNGERLPYTSTASQEREGYGGPLSKETPFGNGTPAYLDPAKAGGLWQPNKVVHTKDSQLEPGRDKKGNPMQVRTYNTLSWWDGPGFNFDAIDEDQSRMRGVTVEWWFYLQFWGRCGDKQKLIDTAQFAIGLRAWSTGKKDGPAQAELNQRNVVWTPQGNQ